MEMKKRRYILLSSLLILVLCFCRKKEEDNPQPVYGSCNCERYFTAIDTFLIRNFLFDTGSYWVYQDSVANTEDSSYNNGPVKNYGVYFHGSIQCMCGDHYRYCYNNTTGASPAYKYTIRDSTLMQYNVWGSCQIGLIGSQNNALVTGSTVSFVGNFTSGNLNFDSVYKCKLVPTCTDAPEPDSGYVYLRTRVGIIRSDTWRGGVHSVYKLMRYQVQ
jgi:hypothetical protein